LKKLLEFFSKEKKINNFYTINIVKNLLENLCHVESVPDIAGPPIPENVQKWTKK